MLPPPPDIGLSKNASLHPVHSKSHHPIPRAPPFFLAHPSRPPFYFLQISLSLPFRARLPAYRVPHLRPAIFVVAESGFQRVTARGHLARDDVRSLSTNDQRARHGAQQSDESTREGALFAQGKEVEEGGCVDNIQTSLERSETIVCFPHIIIIIALLIRKYVSAEECRF